MEKVDKKKEQFLRPRSKKTVKNDDFYYLDTFVVTCPTRIKLFWTVSTPPLLKLNVNPYHFWPTVPYNQPIVESDLKKRAVNVGFNAMTATLWKSLGIHPPFAKRQSYRPKYYKEIMFVLWHKVLVETLTLPFWIWFFASKKEAIIFAGERQNLVIHLECNDSN